MDAVIVLSCFVFNSLGNSSSLEFLRDFPGGSDGKASVYNVGDLGSIPGLGRFPGEGIGYPLQYSALENSIVHGVTRSQTRLSK